MLYGLSCRRATLRGVEREISLLGSSIEFFATPRFARVPLIFSRTPSGITAFMVLESDSTINLVSPIFSPDASSQK